MMNFTSRIAQYPLLRGTPMVTVVTLLIVLCVPALTLAAGHEEITVIPLGQGQIIKGASQQSFRLPMGPNGPLNQALVLMAAQPWAPVQAPVPLNVPPPGEDELERKEQVPGTLKIKIGEKSLPEWGLFKFGTAYVINLETIRGNPEYSKGRLAINFELDSIAENLTIRAFGMPDPLLVSDTLDGPVALFHQAAKTDELKSYFIGFANELAGNKEQARVEYRKLVASQDERLARFARRGLRMLSYDQRPHKLSGNFREHFRWGLFLAQAGVLAPAFREFEECRIIYPMHADAQFRAGEMLDHIEGDVFKVMDYMERSGEASWETNPRIWSTLLVIQKGAGQRRLSATELLDLKVAFILSRYTVWAASRGRVAPKASVLELHDENSWPMITYADGMVGPSRDIVAERGWFDSVIYVRPRTDASKGERLRTIGGDVGPNGAAFSTLYHDATWREFIEAFYQQFAWAADVGEAGDALPGADELADCGHQPIPNLAYGARSALRYHFSPEVFRRVVMVPRPGRRDFARMWQLEGPFPIPQASATGTRHVLDDLPTTPPGGQPLRIVSESDFIDLKRVLPGTGPALARATCWVFSPVEQELRMWIGQNDGAAVWINGRLIHSGRYFAEGEYADQNLVDTVASYAPLQAGWNEVRVTVESLPAPRDKGWGFSLRFANWRDEPVPGLAYLHAPPDSGMVPPYEAPPAGAHYAWERVRRNWAEVLPRLTDADLQQITGVAGLTVSGRAGPSGHALISVPGRTVGQSYRSLSQPWRDGVDRDVAVNNLLDWDREDCAAIRYQKNGQDRDLLLVTPEALGAFMTLLKESPAAAALFGGKEPDERLLGYVILPSQSSSRRLFAIDCLLGDGGAWPIDEEDLLQPIPAKYIPNPPRMLPPYQPQLQPN